jgi:hypothetical protein
VADALSRPPTFSGSVSAAATVEKIKPPSIANPEADLHANNSSVEPIPPASLNFADQPSAQPPAAAAVIDFAAIAAAQQSCPDVAAMRQSPSLSISSRDDSGTQLLGDVSTGTFRPLVPAAFRAAVVRSLHNVHHPGVRATVRLVKASYCWPRMSKDITVLARSCMGCQLGKVHRHVHLEPEHIAVPHRRFSHLHIDLVGPLPKSAGFTHLFTIIDRTTRWPEAVPVSSTAAADCAAALFAGWVQRFGLPAAITSDRGPQFTSALWAALCKLLDITHIPTTA